MEDDKRMLVHLHVGKTSGAAVNRAIRRHFPKDQYLHIKNGPDRFAELDKRIADGSIKEIRAICGPINYTIADRIGEDCDYFTIFRHPIARVCSFFNFIHVTPRHKLHKVLKEKGFTNLNDIADFVPHRIEQLQLQWASATCSRVTGRNDAHAVECQELWATIGKQLDGRKIIIGDVAHITQFLQKKKVIRGLLPVEPKTSFAGVSDFVPASPQSLSEAARRYIMEINQNDMRLMGELIARGTVRDNPT